MENLVNLTLDYLYFPHTHPPNLGIEVNKLEMGQVRWVMASRWLVDKFWGSEEGQGLFLSGWWGWMELYWEVECS